jgi:hypothetical protein
MRPPPLKPGETVDPEKHTLQKMVQKISELQRTADTTSKRTTADKTKGWKKATSLPQASKWKAVLQRMTITKMDFSLAED